MACAVEIRASVVATAAALRSANAVGEHGIAGRATDTQLSGGTRLSNDGRNVPVEASKPASISQFRQVGDNQDQCRNAPEPAHAVVIDNVTNSLKQKEKSTPFSKEDGSRRWTQSVIPMQIFQ